jgi:NADPH:quinone reductase-like Zn-dependent oxidoreductase
MSASPTTALPASMHGVVLTAFGGPEVLHYRDDLPLHLPRAGEVLIRVAASAVNNTDINTRVGWYSKTTVRATEGSAAVFDTARDADPSWGGTPMVFPRIQGADCCGHIAAVGPGVDTARIGQRVLVRPILRAYADYRPYACWYFGSECDGGFAQYTRVPADAAVAIHSALSDVELASFPCAYSTAENLVDRAGVKSGERVLVTGASGGVGSAAVQLARRRGAQVIALAGTDKHAAVGALGAAECLPRDADLAHALGAESVDVVIDLVGGAQWPALLDVLKRGGRYASSGAIAGPLVTLDLRTLYLKDLTLVGCTFQDDRIFDNLVGYIERGEIAPVVAHTFALRDIALAQAAFGAKDFVGKIVLLAPP